MIGTRSNAAHRKLWSEKRRIEKRSLQMLKEKGRLLNVHKTEAEIKLDKELANEIKEMRK